MDKPHRSAYPNDPLFARPLVYGRIDTGVATIRRPGSDEVEVHTVRPAAAHASAVEPSQMAQAQTPAAHGAGRREELIRKAAELYNLGLTWSEIQKQLGVSATSLTRYIRLAREKGLIRTERRSTPDRLVSRLDELEKRVEILSSGLAELTRRIEAMEQRSGAGIDITRELFRLLELAIVGERRQTA